MRRKQLTKRQAWLLVVSSLIIFSATVIIAISFQYWLISNPSFENMLTYNRWLTAIPVGMSTGAAVLFAFGLTKFRVMISVAAIVIGLVVYVFTIAASFYGLFSISVTYSPGYSFEVTSGALQGLFDIGLGIMGGGVVGLLFRGWIGGGKEAPA